MEIEDNNQKQFKINEDWLFQSKQLKLEFPQLTNEDLELQTGNEASIITNIGARLNKTKEEVITLLKMDQLNNC